MGLEEKARFDRQVEAEQQKADRHRKRTRGAPGSADWQP
jgi:hypothetical protein